MLGNVLLGIICFLSVTAAAQKTPNSSGVLGAVVENPFFDDTEIQGTMDLGGFTLCDVRTITPHRDTNAVVRNRGEIERPFVTSLMLIFTGYVCDANGHPMAKQASYFIGSATGLKGYLWYGEDSYDLKKIDPSTSQVVVGVRFDYTMEESDFMKQREAKVQAKYEADLRQSLGERRQLQNVDQIVQLHLDIDFTTWQKYGKQTAGDYMTALVTMASDETFETHGFTLMVRSIEFRNSDPSDELSTAAYLDVIYAEQGLPDDCHLYHSLSARNLGGGIAYLSGLYDRYNAYGVSANIGFSGGYWDKSVISHELGHNFGLSHTHEVIPKIDNCGIINEYDGDYTCTNVPDDCSTVMSYCHLCYCDPQMHFHDQQVEVLLSKYQLYKNTLIEVETCALVETRLPKDDEPFYLTDADQIKVVALESVGGLSNEELSKTNVFKFDHYKLLESADSCQKVFFKGGSYPSETWFKLTNVETGSVCETAEGWTSNNGDVSLETLDCCIPMGEYMLECFDSYGDGWNAGGLLIRGNLHYCGDFDSSGSEEITVEATKAPTGRGQFINPNGECWTAGNGGALIELTPCEDSDPTQIFIWTQDGQLSSEYLDQNLQTNADGLLVVSGGVNSVFDQFCHSIFVSYEIDDDNNDGEPVCENVMLECGGECEPCEEWPWNCFAVTMVLGSYAQEVGWTLGLCDFDALGNESGDYVCCPEGETATLTCTDSWGDSWNGGYIVVDGVKYCDSSTWSVETHELTVTANPNYEGDEPDCVMCPMVVPVCEAGCVNCVTTANTCEECATASCGDPDDCVMCPSVVAECPEGCINCDITPQACDHCSFATCMDEECAVCPAVIHECDADCTGMCLMVMDTCDACGYAECQDGDDDDDNGGDDDDDNGGDGNADVQEFNFEGCFDVTMGVQMELAVTADESGISMCRDQCVSMGYGYFGLNCPSSDMITCHCAQATYAALKVLQELCNDPPNETTCNGPLYELTIDNGVYGLGSSTATAIYGVASTKSCDGKCGGVNAMWNCGCIAGCEASGICCPDFEEMCAEDPGDGPVGCEESCGGQSPEGCWCDNVCTQYGDCCDNFNDVCGDGQGDDSSSFSDSFGGCPEITCWYDETCLSWQQLCDGNTDCYNGEDEWDCGYSSSYMSSYGGSYGYSSSYVSSYGGSYEEDDCDTCLMNNSCLEMGEDLFAMCTCFCQSGSCIYGTCASIDSSDFECFDECVDNMGEDSSSYYDGCVPYSYSPGGWPEENSWSIFDANGTLVCEQTSGAESLDYCCLVEGEYYEINMYDSYGDGWNGGTLYIGAYTFSLAGKYSIEFMNGDSDSSSFSQIWSDDPCSENQSSCFYDPNVCLDDDQYCDGETDCPDGEDEWYCYDSDSYSYGGCADGQSTCWYDYSVCLDDDQWCDGTLDCPDGSDEMYCDDWSSSYNFDCAGVVGGNAVVDACGECGGDGIAEGACDCDGNVDSGCGCGKAAPSGCDNQCESTAVVDECGACGGDGIADGACDCDGNVNDACGICGGDGSSCSDSDVCLSYSFQCGSYCSENTWEIVDSEDNVVCSGLGLDNVDCCLPSSHCGYTVEMTDSYGDGWNGAVLSIDDVDFTLAAGYSSSQDIAAMDCSIDTFTVSFVSTVTVGYNDSVTEVADIARQGAAKALGVSLDEMTVVIKTTTGRRQRRQLGTSVTLEFTYTTTDPSAATDVATTAASPTFSSDLEDGMQEAAAEAGSSITVEGVTVDEVDTDFIVDTDCEGEWSGCDTTTCTEEFLVTTLPSGFGYECNFTTGDTRMCTDQTPCMDCAGVVLGISVVDECGECNGDGSSCLDCAGVPNGTSEVDECLVCGGDGSSCQGCTAPVNCDIAAPGDDCPVAGAEYCAAGGCAASYSDELGLCFSDDDPFVFVDVQCSVTTNQNPTNSNMETALTAVQMAFARVLDTAVELVMVHKHKTQEDSSFEFLVTLTTKNQALANDAFGSLTNDAEAFTTTWNNDIIMVLEEGGSNMKVEGFAVTEVSTMEGTTNHCSIDYSGKSDCNSDAYCQWASSYKKCQSANLDCPILEKSDCADLPDFCIWETGYAENYCRYHTPCDSFTEKKDCKDHEYADGSGCYWNKNDDDDDTTVDIPFCLDYPTTCDYWAFQKSLCSSDNGCMYNQKHTVKCIPDDTPCSVFNKKACKKMNQCSHNKKYENDDGTKGFCFDADLPCSTFTDYSSAICKAWESPDGKCKEKNNECQLK